MSNQVRPSRFNNAQSPYAQDYIKNIEESYAGFGEAASGFAKQFQDLKATEAKAKALVPDADFTSDSGPNSAFSADAQKLMDKINGNAEGSYNFLNAADLERFNSDVADLKKEMKEFEPIYNEAVTNLQKLSLEHDLFMKVGGDPKQAASQEINGVEYYNAKAGTLAFDETMKIADALRYGEVRTGDDGKVTVVDQNGQTVSEYGSRQDYLKAIVELGKPDLQPIPITDGKTLVEEKRWGSYDTETKAESAFLNYVLNNPALAERRRREKLGLTGPEPEGAETSEEVQALLDKHPKTSEGFDNMSQSQYDYVQEMMQGWRDLQEVEEPKSTSASSSSKKLDGLVGQIGGANLTINTGLGDLEESVGGASGLVVKGKVGLDGGKEGSLKKIIYNPNSQEAGGSGFSVIIFDGEKDVVMPFDPKPGDQAKDAIAAALGLSQEDMIKLLREIKNKGE
jgi:hypothetical protein